MIKMAERDNVKAAYRVFMADSGVAEDLRAWHCIIIDKFIDEVLPLAGYRLCKIPKAKNMLAGSRHIAK